MLYVLCDVINVIIDIIHFKGKKSIWNNDHHFNPVIIFNPVMLSSTLLFDSFY